MDAQSEWNEQPCSPHPGMQVSCDKMDASLFFKRANGTGIMVRPGPKTRFRRGNEITKAVVDVSAYEPWEGQLLPEDIEVLFTSGLMEEEKNA